MGARSILLAALSLAAARGFQALRGASTRTLLRAATVEAAPAATGERLSAERYVVQNRFKVKKGREAAFEKRWADRESRLGNLDGFRFFCMLRREAGSAPHRAVEVVGARKVEERVRVLRRRVHLDVEAAVERLQS